MGKKGWASFGRRKEKGMALTADAPTREEERRRRENWFGEEMGKGRTSVLIKEGRGERERHFTRCGAGSHCFLKGKEGSKEKKPQPFPWNPPHTGGGRKEKSPTPNLHKKKRGEKRRAEHTKRKRGKIWAYGIVKRVDQMPSISCEKEGFRPQAQRDQEKGESWDENNGHARKRKGGGTLTR